ncbi:MAG: GNAT family N-acetyltransferase [Fimbriimonadaceae bacterium]|nr:GNAT family N-acetyltransferase [Fimbriimonadaceae bacterium]
MERICRATALRGRLRFRDPHLVAQLWLQPYLRPEPQHCWVAEAAGEVVGYLVASLHDGFPGRVLRANWWPLLKLLGYWVRGRYYRDAASQRLVHWLFVRLWRETPGSPAGHAHCHFNLAGPWRGQGVGEALVEQFEAQCRDAGLPGYYGILFSTAARRSERLYQRLGFRIHDRRACSLFEPEAVELLCVVKTWGERAWAA